MPYNFPAWQNDPNVGDSCQKIKIQFSNSCRVPKETRFLIQFNYLLIPS